MKDQSILFKDPFVGGTDLELGGRNQKDESRNEMPENSLDKDERRNETPENSSDLPCIFKTKENKAVEK